MSHETAAQIDLRVRKSYLITGVFCAIGFAVFGFGSVFAAAWNIDGSFPRPIPFAVFYGIFWGAWFAASLFIIAAYFREQLTVTSISIKQQGVFRTRRTTIADISNIKWRLRPIGGSVVIRSPTARIKIHFDNFTAEERTALIARLHELISEGGQEGWAAFLKGQQPQPLHPQKSRGTAAICMLSFLTTGAAAVYCWHAGFGAQFLVVGTVSFVVTLWYCFRILRFVSEPESDTTA